MNFTMKKLRKIIFVIILLAGSMTVLGGLRVAHATPFASKAPASFVVPGTGFDGLSEVPVIVPPDVQVAAGGGHLLEVVNRRYTDFSNTGYNYSGGDLSQIFGTGNDFLSDPKVRFDTGSQRWFVTIVDQDQPCCSQTRSATLLAVSSSSSPGGWHVYHTISFGTNVITDQPLLGLNNDKVVISFNKFDGSGGHLIGAQWYVFNKTDLVSFADPPKYASFGPYSSLSSIFPVDSLGPTTSEYMVSTSSDESSYSNTTAVQLFTITGVPGTTVTVSNVSLTVNPIADPVPGREPPPPPCGRYCQPGTVIDTNDRRVREAVWYRDRLWLGLNDACKPNGYYTRACIRFIQIDTSATLVKQDFDYGNNNLDYFYPALSIDRLGSLIVIYGFSSSSYYPSLAVTGQAFSDSSASLVPSVTIRNGTQMDASERYGDYFGAALDPSDTGNVWLAGEYINKARGLCVNDSLNGKWYCWSTYIDNARIWASLNINSTSTFTGVTVNTSGKVSINPSQTGNYTLSGTVSVLATNATTGGNLFSKTYSVSGVYLTNSSGREPYTGKFIVNVQVSPYPLGTAITATFNLGSTSVTAQLGRNLDISHDGRVDDDDLAAIHASWQCQIGQQCYDPRVDINADGIININDVTRITNFYGKLDFI